jgi:hypothetical protein
MLSSNTRPTPEMIADAVVAAYIHAISDRHRPLEPSAAPRRVESPHAIGEDE